MGLRVKLASHTKNNIRIFINRLDGLIQVYLAAFLALEKLNIQFRNDRLCVATFVLVLPSNRMQRRILLHQIGRDI